MGALGRLKRYAHPREWGLQRRAAMASAGVAVTALVVFAIIAVVAPRSAHRGSGGTAEQALADIGSSPLAAPAVSAAILGTPSASTDPYPLPTTTAGLLPTYSPTDAPLGPARVIAAMRVSANHVRTGDSLIYRVVLTNVGGRTFRGAFTVNQHTPAGTLRCVDTDPTSACAVPGDYTGDSQDPSAPHANPEGTTRIMTIPAHRSLVVTELRVQVSGVAGMTLHNHAHVEGVGAGNSSTTTDAEDASSAGLDLNHRIIAPDVMVLRTK